MRFIYLPVLFGMALILQSAVIPIILPNSLASGFDLPLVITVHVALTRGKTRGMLAGLLLGYLQDAMSGGVLGFNGLSKIVGGFTGGYLKEKFFVRSMAHRTASVAGAVFLALLSKSALYSLFSQPGPSFLSTQFFWSFTGCTLLALVGHVFLERFETVFGIRAEEELSLGD